MGEGKLVLRTVACVLKSGGWQNRRMYVEYTPDHVRWLRDQFRAQVSAPHRFVCLTDYAVIAGVETIRLQDDLPGWWSKLELFRELDDAFYVDIDTVITGDISHMLAHPHRFSVLRNLSSPAGRRIGSGVMAWRGDYSHLYRRFMRAPESHMAECRTGAKWGDQGFIEHEQLERDYLQDLFPGQIVSYKLGLGRGDPGPDHRIVCFHGEPRPWQVRHSWVPRFTEAA